MFYPFSMNAEIDVTNIQIETSRLILRPFKESDLDDFYRYAKVPGVGECAGWPHHESVDTSKMILDKFINEKKTFAIAEKESSRVVGSIGLEPERCDLPEAFSSIKGREIGYVLAKDKWGNGYMSEAVKALISYCFSTLGYDFLLCGHFYDNYRSERVIVKNGFVFLKDIMYETVMGEVKPTRLYYLANPLKKINS